MDGIYETVIFPLDFLVVDKYKKYVELLSVLSSYYWALRGACYYSSKYVGKDPTLFRSNFDDSRRNLRNLATNASKIAQYLGDSINSTSHLIVSMWGKNDIFRFLKNRINKKCVQKSVVGCDSILFDNWEYIDQFKQYNLR